MVRLLCISVINFLSFCPALPFFCGNSKFKAMPKKAKNTDNTTRKITVPRDPAKHEYAYMLFMQNVTQDEICKRVGISPPTLKDWKTSGNWAAKRASRNISLDDLMQKALSKINDMLDSNDFNADAFSKAVKQLKELKVKNTVDDEINVFMSFQDFMLQQRVAHKELTDEFIKMVVKYQDYYIQFRLGHGKLAQ